jgi:hypothetical protein
MSTIVTNLKNHSRAELTISRALPADPPHLVLWLTGGVAFVLCAVAFALWGVTGSRALFDMTIALCT